MGKAQLGVRIDPGIKKAVEEICEERGQKIYKFVEDALLDKLEELEDIEDLKKIRRESNRSFDEVLKELKSNEKI